MTSNLSNIFLMNLNNNIFQELEAFFFQERLLQSVSTKSYIVFLVAPLGIPPGLSPKVSPGAFKDL